MTVLDWLLDSDPAIRWQVLPDLVQAPAEIVAAERARLRPLVVQYDDQRPGRTVGARARHRWLCGVHLGSAPR
jgi:hypothetical protein